MGERVVDKFLSKIPSLQELRRKVTGGQSSLAVWSRWKGGGMPPNTAFGRMFQSAHSWAMLEGTAMAVVLKNSPKLKCKRSFVQDLLKNVFHVARLAHVCRLSPLTEKLAAVQKCRKLAKFFTFKMKSWPLYEPIFNSTVELQRYPQDMVITQSTPRRFKEAEEDKRLRTVSWSEIGEFYPHEN